MGALVAELFEDYHEKEIRDYLSGYWLENDIWLLGEAAFEEAGIHVGNKKGILADFTSYKNSQLKNEMKFYLLHALKEGCLTVPNVFHHYRHLIKRLGQEQKADSFACAGVERPRGMASEPSRLYELLQRNVTGFIKDYYDKRPELDKEVWHAAKIPGVKVSAAARRQKPSISFEEIPAYYRPCVKRYMKNLIYRRSWSFCTETLVYLRYYYKRFYGHGYGGGFQESLERKDVERYLEWVAQDHKEANATFRSKAVSFIRNYLDFIQLAQYDTAPRKDVTRLIFDEDIPKRERVEDTYEKIKYIPEPVRNELDSAVSEIEPEEMKPVYILLRETGWRGTDILNLRYDRCLDYVWNSHTGGYVPYLCGEITKTGIPMHKIPVRNEVAEMIKGLIRQAQERSTDENNPERYLFNTYEGKGKGLPYSKPAFAAAVQRLIERKGIRDGDGKLYHFRTHSLRHTRALEYTEQGMPLGIIRQILGHCSLQMTLHYAKVSEDMLYRKWKETEELALFVPDVAAPAVSGQRTEEICYENIRKNLDAVRVPLGMCFKQSKIGCKSQMTMCLECGSFCSTQADIPEYEEEIRRAEEQIRIGEKLGRQNWVEKNREYLENLQSMKERILRENIVHKNGRLREG